MQEPDGNSDGRRQSTDAEAKLRCKRRFRDGRVKEEMAVQMEVQARAIQTEER